MPSVGSVRALSRVYYPASRVEGLCRCGASGTRCPVYGRGKSGEPPHMGSQGWLPKGDHLEARMSRPSKRILRRGCGWFIWIEYRGSGRKRLYPARRRSASSLFSDTETLEVSRGSCVWDQSDLSLGSWRNEANGRDLPSYLTSVILAADGSRMEAARPEAGTTSAGRAQGVELGRRRNAGSFLHGLTCIWSPSGRVDLVWTDARAGPW